MPKKLKPSSQKNQLRENSIRPILTLIESVDSHGEILEGFLYSGIVYDGYIYARRTSSPPRNEYIKLSLKDTHNRVFDEISYRYIQIKGVDDPKVQVIELKQIPFLIHKSLNEAFGKIEARIITLLQRK